MKARTASTREDTRWLDVPLLQLWAHCCIAQADIIIIHCISLNTRKIEKMFEIQVVHLSTTDVLTYVSSLCTTSSFKIIKFARHLVQLHRQCQI
jgi:hypothetical protein